MKRRDTLARLALGAAATTLPPLAAAQRPAPASAAAAANGAAEAPRVLRYAISAAETSFDPAQINDNTSRTITSHIFESRYCYDHLARPPVLVPLVADGEPLAEDEFRRWTFKVRPGIHFADDPAFKGGRRELVAADFLYAIRRYADPVLKSPLWASVENFKVLGLAELRKEALEKKAPFDYDRPLPGMTLLDRYTFQVHLAEPRPRFKENMAVPDLFGAVAREVAEAYGDKIGEHPVGTGPFRLAQWRRSSRIVLERNPNYRERAWDCRPAADDAEGQALAARLRGKRLPLVDRVEIAIIEEAQPRWLAFVNGEHDFLDRLPPEFASIAIPGHKVAPHLAKKGVRGAITLQSDVTFYYFNMEDPVVGGLEPAKVALRRAFGLAIDTEREIRLMRRGLAIPAQGPIVPHTTGYDPKFKSEMSEYSPSRAKALLDLHGYVDRDGDGWREKPDGTPLTLEISTLPEQVYRQFNQLLKRDMDAIGVRVVFKIATWPENLKAGRAGKLQIWSLSSLGSGGDGQGMITRYYGPQAGNQNFPRFRHPRMDAIHERMTVLPDGPERQALFAEACKIAIAYMPYKFQVHRLVADLMHASVVGYRRPAYWNGWWQYVDVTPGPSPA
ncbi:MAG: bicyclomycin resistance protein [Rubrivivax sp.]|nr:bicyclomycin resistance protein [Rubrivivax sp.]